MIKIIQSYKVDGSVIALHADEFSIFFTSTMGILYTVDKTLWTMESHSLISEGQSSLHAYQKGAAFSKSGHVGYSTGEKGSCSVCLKLPVLSETSPKSSVNTADERPKPLVEDQTFLRGHDQRSEVMAFCGDTGKYVLTGGTDGKVYMYSTHSAAVLMSLKPNPDYISHLTLNEKGSHLAYSSYDKSLTVFDIRHQKEILMTYLGDVVEDSFFYNRSNSLYAIRRDGVSYTYDLKSKDASEKALFPSWPSCCVVEASHRFAIVGTRSGDLHIVKLSDNTKFSTFKLDQKGIASLYIDGSTLLIGFENGWTYVIDMYAFVDDFSQALSVKNYKAAKRYLDQNLFLTIHPMSEMFQDAWEETLKEITDKFSTGNASSALEFAAPFLSDNEHKKEFEFLLKKQKEFEKFADIVQNKKVFEAYAMLEQSPYLSKTDSARKLELYFIKAFADAKKLISTDPLRNGEKAHELLKPYSTVPAKKEMIFSFFKNFQVFLQADGYIKEKRFKDYFTLTSMYPFLTSEEVYTKICTLAESAIKKIKNMIENHQYDEAMQGIKQIAVFLPYKETLSSMIREIHLRKKFLELINSDNMKSAYELVNSNPELETMQEFIEFDAAFDEILSQAMVAVEKGEIKLTQQILSSYSGIGIFQPKIRECIRQSSYNKLSNLLSENNRGASKTIAAYYIKEFGKDAEYEKLLKKYGLDH
jgi:hypothetical protein